MWSLYTTDQALDMKTKTSQYKYMLGGVAALLVIVALIWLTPAIARESKARKEKQAAKTEKVIIIDEDGNRTTYYTDELPSSVRKTIDATVEAGGRTTGSVLKLADAVISDLDVSGLTREVTRTLAAVRLSDFTAEVDRALEDIDWDGINMEVDRTLDDLHRELNNPMLRRDLKVRLEEAQDELAMAADGMGDDISQAREELVSARRELAAARTETRGKEDITSNPEDNSYEAMLKQMEADELIAKAEGFDIKKSGNELLINGRSQPDKVFNKYQRYLKGKDVTIKGDTEGTTIQLK
jgi:hypothetical protein